MVKRMLMIGKEDQFYRELKDLLQCESIKIHRIESTTLEITNFLEQDFCIAIVDIDILENRNVSVLKKIRDFKSIPILVISSVPGKVNKRDVLQAGALVYLNKPCDPKECAIYVQSLIRFYFEVRLNTEKKDTVIWKKDLIIDVSSHQVLFHGRYIALTRKEFDLLYCLTKYTGQVLSREQLYKMVWKEENIYNVDEIIKAHIKALRKKLGKDGANYIQNVWGIGYRFSEDL